MKILVTGGAGYIGSVLTHVLLKNNHEVVVLDDLSNGDLDSVNKGAEFYKGDVGDAAILESIFSKHKIDAVAHLAGFIQVGESVKEPNKYFTNNVGKPLVLLTEMRKADVNVLLFSSTAAVYGVPQEIPIPETHSTFPINPYGLSKLMLEEILLWEKNNGLKYAALRYFNASGAVDQFGETHQPETHLIPLLLETALGRREYIEVYGSDYDTEDGTCLRDYVHVLDIAEAHLVLLDRLVKGEAEIGNKVSDNAYNIGNGSGFTINQVIATAEKVVGKKINVKYGPRREGDPSRLVASSEKLSKLGWQPKHNDLEKIIESAWVWHQKRVVR
jgi:UDP-glucose 4-epimerase